MAVQPRFLLMPVILATTSSETAALRWSFARGRARPIEDAMVAWRVLGANNRELGRSVGVYPLGQAREQILALQAEAGRLTSAMVVADGGGWIWRASLDGTLVATAARSYYRQRECHYSTLQFLAAVPVAAICDHVTTKSDLALRDDVDPLGLQPPFTGSTSGVRPKGCSA